LGGGEVRVRHARTIQVHTSRAQRRLNNGEWRGQWYEQATEKIHREYGDTPLIAAMRCYVASKLGNKVEIPTELTQGKAACLI